MSSVHFNVTNGSPRLTRTTNVPNEASFTFCCWIQITNYEDDGPFFYLENTGTVEFIYLYYNALGTLLIQDHDGTSTDIWNDTYTGWSFIAMTKSGATTTVYYRRAGQTTLTSVSGAFDTGFTTNRVSIGGSQTVGGDSEGQHRFGGTIIYSAVLSSTELIAQSFCRKPIRWSNLNFWNPCFATADVNVDYSGTGGNFTTTGVPTDSTEDPNISWDPNYFRQ